MKATLWGSILVAYAILLAGCAAQPSQTERAVARDTRAAAAESESSADTDGRDFPGQGSRVRGAIRTTAGGAAAAAEVLPGGIQYGLLHAHTFFSDGSGTPTQAFQRAKQTGVDFFAVTEHNHAAAESSAGDRKDGVLIATKPELYNSAASVTVTRHLEGEGGQSVNVSSLLSAAASATNGRFVAMYGQEFSTISSGNHVNVIGWKEVIGVKNGDYKSLFELFDAAVAQGEPAPIVQMNHPDFRRDLISERTKEKEKNNDYGIDDYEGDFGALVEAAAEYVSLIELLSGPATVEESQPEYRYGSYDHERDYFFYLSEGFHISPSVGHDNHYETWGDSAPSRMGVLASNVTEEALFAAIRRNRTFASEDTDARVSFTINGKPMGSVLELTEGASLQIAVEMSDATDEVGGFTATLVRGEVASEQLPNITNHDHRDASEEPVSTDDSRLVFPKTTAGGGAEFYYVRIEQNEDGDRIWTAPIWINHARTRDQ